jgi:hypothetical protein
MAHEEIRKNRKNKLNLLVCMHLKGTTLRELSIIQIPS